MSKVEDPSIDLLRVHASTRGLDDQQLRLLASNTEVVHFQEGDVVHPANQVVDALFLVFSGRLRIAAALPDGSERTIQFLSRDDQFGLLALSQDEVFPLLVEADQPSTLLRIGKDTVHRLLQSLPLWARNLLRSLGPLIQETVLGLKLRRPTRVVAVIHADDGTRYLTPVLARRLSELGEKVGLLSDHEEVLASLSGTSSSLLDDHGRVKDPEAIRPLFSQWQEMQRIFVDMHIDRAAEVLTRLAAGCDATFWICTSESAGRVTAELKPFIQSSPGSKKTMRLIWALRDDEPVAPVTPELSDLCEQDFKLHWQGRPDSTVCTRHCGLERIVHHLRGISIGLALGGGAARGMAHLGVLQVLEENGITIDRISGTSAGAMTGILHAAGISANSLIEIFAGDLKPGWFYRWLPHGDTFFMLQKFRQRGWESMLRGYLHDWRLEQLPIPVSSMTADLVSASEVVRSNGDAVQAMLESINLPYISQPICRDGGVLVDGGVLNVVPADVLVRQGANVVIAVDVAAKISFEFLGNRPDTPTSQMKVPNAVQTAVRLRTVQDRNIRSVGGSAADLVIEPDVSTVVVSDFKRAPEIAKLGRAAAEEALPKLRTILKQTDPQLFGD